VPLQEKDRHQRRRSEVTFAIMPPLIRMARTMATAKLLSASPRHSGRRAKRVKDARKRAFGAPIRNLAEMKKIPGSPLRGAPE
jgi:hypothetical protein